MGAGRYDLTNVPSSHPLRLYDALDMCIVNLHKCDVIVSENKESYCTGNTSWIIDDSCNGRTLSIDCVNHGAMGGIDRLPYNAACLEPPSPPPLPLLFLPSPVPPSQVVSSPEPDDELILYDPSPPLPLDVGVSYAVVCELRVDATVDTFDRDAFVHMLAAFLSVDPSDIVLTIESGSILVTATITAASNAAAISIVDQLTSLSETLASTEFGIVVENIGIPVIVPTLAPLSPAVLVSLPPPVAPPPPVSPPPLVEDRTVIGAIAATASAIIVFSMILHVVFRWRHTRSRIWDPQLTVVRPPHQ